MKKVLFFSTSLLIGIAVFSLATSDIGIEEIKEVFSFFPLWGLAVVLVLTFLIALTCIWRLQFILKTQGHHISLHKVGEIWASGWAISYLTPISILGGEVFMVYALKKGYGVSWSKSSAVIFIHRVLDATVFFPFMILGLFAFVGLSGSFPRGKIITAGGIVAGILLVLLAIFYFKSFRKKSPLEFFLRLFGINRKKLAEKEGGRLVLAAESEILPFFGLRKKVMWQGLGMAVIKYILVLLRVWVVIYFFQGGIHFLNAFSAYGFFNLATLVPVPAMLGSLEMAERIAFEGMGLGANVGIAFSLLLRSMDILICIIGIILTIKIGMILIKTKVLEVIDKIFNNRTSLFVN